MPRGGKFRSESALHRRRKVEPKKSRRGPSNHSLEEYLKTSTCQVGELPGRSPTKASQKGVSVGRFISFRSVLRRRAWSYAIGLRRGRPAASQVNPREEAMARKGRKSARARRNSDKGELLQRLRRRQQRRAGEHGRTEGREASYAAATFPIFRSAAVPLPPSDRWSRHNSSRWCHFWGAE